MVSAPALHLTYVQSQFEGHHIPKGEPPTATAFNAGSTAPSTRGYQPPRACPKPALAPPPSGQPPAIPRANSGGGNAWAKPLVFDTGSILGADSGKQTSKVSVKKEEKGDEERKTIAEEPGKGGGDDAAEAAAAKFLHRFQAAEEDSKAKVPEKKDGGNARVMNMDGFSMEDMAKFARACQKVEVEQLSSRQPTQTVVEDKPPPVPPPALSPAEVENRGAVDPADAANTGGARRRWQKSSAQTNEANTSTTDTIAADKAPGCDDTPIEEFFPVIRREVSDIKKEAPVEESPRATDTDGGEDDMAEEIPRSSADAVAEPGPSSNKAGAPKSKASSKAGGGPKLKIPRSSADAVAEPGPSSNKAGAPKSKASSKAGGGPKLKIPKAKADDTPKPKIVDPKAKMPKTKDGVLASVQKHSSMGCAVITMREARVRNMIVAEAGSSESVTIAGIRVDIKPHQDKETGKDEPLQIFAAWGRKVEKATPLSESDLVDFFGNWHLDLVQRGLVPSQGTLTDTEDASVIESSSSNTKAPVPECLEPEPESEFDAAEQKPEVEEPTYQANRAPQKPTYCPPEGTVMVAVKRYLSEAAGYLSLELGDLVEVLHGAAVAGDRECSYSSYIYGSICPGGAAGWFPLDVVWERYTDSLGKPWLFHAQTGAWRWEDELYATRNG
eukprot:gnl/TRDRNA2_/TRDRNA2_172034_c0_seq2.p1 gnl/TRDRNA2_/TRDRNA2_172034_c0~~gnl/TRDRNA2_/TRDRNA2_172034_c0_seq2.p1  ORF type:complete len:736 (+),score=144.95 gnl/TRDRNA2_/TRDRNA2_172034_c0_seq2:204-2210(+)